MNLYIQRVFRKYRPVAVLMVFILLSFTAGCGGPDEKDLIEQQDLNPDYIDVLERWTDEAEIYGGVEFEFQAVGTYKSKDFRRAYIRKYTDEYHTEPPKAREMLLEQISMSEDFIEFLVAITCSMEEGTDLVSRDTVWRVYLEGASMGRLEPFDIRLVKRSKVQLAHFYPFITPWAKIYHIRFAAPDAIPQSGNFKLVLTGVLGTANLEYQLED